MCPGSPSVFEPASVYVRPGSRQVPLCLFTGCPVCVPCVSRLTTVSFYTPGVFLPVLYRCVWL